MVLDAVPALSPNGLHAMLKNYGGFVIEITTFLVRSGVDDARIIETDYRMQTEVAYQQVGLVRRTTARSSAGQWVVISVWRTEADADVGAERRSEDPVVIEFDSLIDPTSVVTTRYLGAW